jgi:hypothetical protein
MEFGELQKRVERSKSKNKEAIIKSGRRSAQI